MKINILSSFNPSNFTLNIHSMWMILIMIYFLMSKNKMEKLNLILKMMISKNLFQSITMEKKIMKTNNMKMFSMILLTIFFTNVYSLSLYSFSLTSQMNFNFSMIFFLWMITFFMEMKFFKNFIIHLCPKNCPLVLSNFMIFIELVSFMIRPIVLILRLTINMFSGHMMMMMMSMGMIMSTSMFFIFIPMLMFMLLKIMVSLIQSYILSMLIMIYMNQSNIFTV